MSETTPDDRRPDDEGAGTGPDESKLHQEDVGTEAQPGASDEDERFDAG